jgi:2-polyprenyl-3-methyl-5-hydroxy-6-metoxy-1,4-benzoquinol methylase
VSATNSRCSACHSSSFHEKYPDELGTHSPSLDYEFSPHTRKTFRIVECEICRHQFCDPMPNLESGYEETVDLTYLSTKQQRIKTAASSLKIIDAYLKTGSRLLDVGCNAGFFLDVASTQFEVEGIELSNWSADLAAMNHLVHRLPLSSLHLSEKFDGLTLFGVIEHFSDPSLEIAAAFRALKPGGFIFIYTGDKDALIPRLLKKKWWWYQGMHLQYFSKSSLRQLIERTGFIYVHSRRFPLFFSLNSLSTSMNRYRLLTPGAKILASRFLKPIHIRISVSGEMLLIAQKPSS